MEEEKASGSLPLSSQESKQCCASADWSPLLPFAALRIASLSLSLPLSRRRGWGTEAAGT